ncbi:probable cytochrome P450 6g2 [Lutzomyia longipalpis]|uniref:probable cytochrome P450 6g2 n=1 Tax=Lutzomyia longipalpis TaxID=7200 RepID=UPI0024837926|nr:probable cytochrome P450 6g2 [Lutzomyia longipalpis]
MQHLLVASSFTFIHLLLVSPQPNLKMVVLVILLAFVAFLCLITWWWQVSCSSYWRVRGVPYIAGFPFIGALRGVVFFQKSVTELFLQLYNDAETKNEPIVGFYFFHKPSLLIRDPELIKRILVKDFNNFPDRRLTPDPQTDGVGFNIMPVTKGDTWKKVRGHISPVFTGVRMKNFFALLSEVAKVFEKKMARDTQNGCHVYDVKDLFGHLTLDMIAICAFGIETNSLSRDSEFYAQVKKITDFTLERSINFNGAYFFPELSPILKFNIIPKSTSNFLRNSIKEVMEVRERTNTMRQDLIDVLIRMKNTNKDVFFGDVLVAQAAIFVSAGYETTSSATSFALYELAKHPQIQEKVREEILKELENGGISYERINKLEYLNMVIQETLRLYPTVPFLDRVFMPTGQQGEFYTLEPHHKFSIPRGMPVYIPVVGIHRDPKFYPDPLTFNPERFRVNERGDRNQYVFLSFGQGPRGCIGARFGMLQVKLALISVLKSFRVECCDTTPRTIRISKKSLIMQSEDPINLIFRKL